MTSNIYLDEITLKYLKNCLVNGHLELIRIQNLISLFISSNNKVNKEDINQSRSLAFSSKNSENRQKSFLTIKLNL